jgi:DNA invertase Pin-like site-specific DNA recombinase
MNNASENAPQGRRVAFYLRSACAPQYDPGSALTNQRLRLLEAVARHDLVLVAAFSDAGASGLEINRPGLSRLLQEANKAHPPFDIVMIESPSRLTRDLGDLGIIGLQLTMRGIQLYRADLGIFCHVSPLKGSAEKV